MKKIVIVTFFILSFISSIVTHAQQSNSDKICRVSVYMESNSIERSKLYKYETTQNNEISYICHYLKILTTTEGQRRIYFDGDVLNVQLDFNEGKMEEFSFYYMLNCLMFSDGLGNTFSYDISTNDYLRFFDFMVNLKSKKIKLEDNITYDISDWAEEDVNKSISKGFLPPWQQINYTGKIPRVEVCQILDNFLHVKGANIGEAENVFEDTRDLAVNVLYKLGIISGKSETEFFPYDNITREEYVSVIDRLYERVWADGEEETGDIIFTDKSEISGWALEGVRRMTSLGIIQGYEDGSFNPKANVTKEQAVAMLLRLNDTIEDG